MEHPIQTVILALLQFVGALIICYGFWFQFTHVTLLGMLYCFPWYILCGASHVLGLLAIIAECIEDELKGDAALFMQHNYFTAWLALVVGYPAMVSYVWMMYYGPEVLVQLHLLLSVIPLVAWIQQASTVAMRSTQYCTGAACISHAYISYLAGDMMGIVCSVVMAFALVFMSVPTRYQFLQFSSREVLVILLIISSYLMNVSVTSMDKSRGSVKSVLPL